MTSYDARRAGDPPSPDERYFAAGCAPPCGRPEFLAINPAGKLPVLVDGDLVLNESVAIVLYLAEKYPDRGFLPRGVAGRAEAYRWLLFAATEVEQPLWRITRHTNLYPEERRLPGDVVLASEEFKEMAAVLERHMEGREFVVGDHVSVADFVTAYTLDWGSEVRLLGGFPTLGRYLERMYARPRAPLRIAAASATLRGGSRYCVSPSDRAESKWCRGARQFISQRALAVGMGDADNGAWPDRTRSSSPSPSA